MIFLIIKSRIGNKRWVELCHISTVLHFILITIDMISMVRTKVALWFLNYRSL